VTGTKLKSDRADANSVSHILWIALVVAIIAGLNLALYQGGNYGIIKAKWVAGRIRNSKCYFKEGRPCSYFSTDYGDDNIQYGYEPAE